MNLKEWFLVTIRERVLNVLDGLADEFKEDGKLNWRKAVKVFSDFCEDKPDFTQKDAVDKVLNGLNLTDKVEMLKATWKKIPQRLRNVLTVSLEDYNESEHSEDFKWKVLGNDGEELVYNGFKGPWQSVIDFNARAELGLELQALDCDAAGKAIGIECEDQERLLKMGLLGKLEVGAAASLPTGFVGIKGEAEARGKASLDYYFANNARLLFIEALIQDLPNLASPFDAEGISGKAEHQLKAIQLNVEGSVGASIDISAGEVFEATFKEGTPAVPDKIGVAASVKVGFQAGFKLNGAWNVLVIPDNQNHSMLMVKVEKDTSKEKSTSISLDASVGISGLDKVGEAVSNRFLPDANKLLEKLKEYSNFGSLLEAEVKNKLKELLNADTDDTLENKLVEVLVGEDNAGKLADVMGSAVETTLNEKLDLLEDKASRAGKSIIKGVVDKLDLRKRLGKNLTNKLVNTAKGKLAEFLNSIVDKLKKSLDEIINNNQDNLENIFKPLETIGETVEDLIEKANQDSQQLLTPVIKYLTRYQDFRNKVTAVAQSISGENIGLHLGRSLNVSQGTSTLLEFEVDTSFEKAREYYKQMVAGNFKEALNAKKDLDGVDLIGGSFKTYREKKLSTDFSLNIFGFKITSQTIMNSKVHIDRDAARNIVMAKSKAEFEKSAKVTGESRMVQFINIMQIPGSTGDQDAGPRQTKIFSSDLSLTYRDTKLNKDELDAYLGSLGKLKLLSKDRMKAVLSRYDELEKQAKKEKKKMKGEIQLSMALESTDINNLIEKLDDETEPGWDDKEEKDKNIIIKNAALDHQLNSYLSYLTTLNKEKRKAFIEVLANWGSGFDTDLNPEMLMKQIKKQITEIARVSKEGNAQGDVLRKYRPANGDMNRVSPTDKHYLLVAQDIGVNVNNLVKIVRNLRDAAKIPSTDKNLKKTTLERYNIENNKALKGWLKLDKIIIDLLNDFFEWLINIFFKGFKFKKMNISPFTRAFIATIGELCQLGEQGNGQEFLSPVVKWSVLDWKEEIFV